VRTVGFDVLASVWARSGLSEDEAMRLAVEATHAVRAEKRASRGFLTPNVLVSALISPGGPSAAAPAGAARRAFDRRLADPAAELGDVLERPKFRPYVTAAEAAAYVELIGHEAAIPRRPAAGRGAA